MSNLKFGWLRDVINGDLKVPRPTVLFMQQLLTFTSHYGRIWTYCSADVAVNKKLSREKHQDSTEVIENLCFWDTSNQTMEEGNKLTSSLLNIPYIPKF